MSDARLQGDQFTLTVIACLLNKLGKEVTITQQDFDDVAYSRMAEIDNYSDGTFTLVLDKLESCNAS